MVVSDCVDDVIVTFRDGFVSTATPFRLLLELESRGFSVSSEGEATLVAQPAARLTRDGCTRIRRWKQELLALVNYCAEGGHDAHLCRD